MGRTGWHLPDRGEHSVCGHTVHLEKVTLGNDNNQLTSVYSTERVLKNVEMKF